MQAVPQGHTLVVGLGVSGWAIARHLTRQARPFMVADTRQSPPGLEAFRAAFPGVEIHCGRLDEIDASRAVEIVVSPGVDPRSPGLARYWQATLEGAELPPARAGVRTDAADAPSPAVGFREGGTTSGGAGAVGGITTTAPSVGSTARPRGSRRTTGRATCAS